LFRLFLSAFVTLIKLSALIHAVGVIVLIFETDFSVHVLVISILPLVWVLCGWFLSAFERTLYWHIASYRIVFSRL